MHLTFFCQFISHTCPIDISSKMIHKCNKCEYQSNRRYNLKVHLKNMHGYQEPSILSHCAHCDYKSPYSSQVISHMNAAHPAQETMLYCCCTSNDECGTRRHDMTVDEVRTLINHSFHVFQHYMKIQASEDGNENMIEESIDVFKCYMLKKINE